MEPDPAPPQARRCRPATAVPGEGDARDGMTAKWVKSRGEISMGTFTRIGVTASHPSRPGGSSGPKTVTRDRFKTAGTFHVKNMTAARRIHVVEPHRNPSQHVPRWRSTSHVLSPGTRHDVPGSPPRCPGNARGWPQGAICSAECGQARPLDGPDACGANVGRFSERTCQTSYYHPMRAAHFLPTTSVRKRRGTFPLGTLSRSRTSSVPSPLFTTLTTMVLSVPHSPGGHAARGVRLKAEVPGDPLAILESALIRHPADRV